jgi:hypothetical protein
MMAGAGTFAAAWYQLSVGVSGPSERPPAIPRAPDRDEDGPADQLGEPESAGCSKPNDGHDGTRDRPSDIGRSDDPEERHPISIGEPHARKLDATVVQVCDPDDPHQIVRQRVEPD